LVVKRNFLKQLDIIVEKTSILLLPKYWIKLFV
jgi:hypothetical protein